MYAWIVRAKVRKTFAQINDGNYLPMVDGLAPEFEYRFHGEHALGGVRTSRDAMIRWWERTLRLLPGARFDVQDVLVGGGPWRTRIAVRSRVSGALPGGARYENTVFQFMTLRWG
ncbi:MAG: nuclear transport factor 2 family protein, partial [Microbacterium sp.]